VANYPGFLTLADSTATADSGIEPVRATNGTLKLRRLWATDKGEFEIGHVLASADKATLDGFYTTNKDLDITYRWPSTGATFTVRFVAPPRYTPRGAYFEARVRLMEV
jgi:hypothetical protein